MKKAEGAVKNIDRNYAKKGNLTPFRKKLSKMGVCYRLGNYNMSPSRYAMIRVFAGILVALVAYLFGARILSILGIFAGYFLVPVIFKYLNKRDNERMFMDIYSTYSNLKIQLESGIYMGDCLDYTYGIVENKRYKEALKELVLNFSDKTITSAEAVDIFRDRFDSKEIDKLCRIMSGFVQYGISENYLNDIMRETTSLLASENERAKHAIETKTGVITFGFFTLVIVVVAVAMLGNLGGYNIFAM